MTTRQAILDYRTTGAEGAAARVISIETALRKQRESAERLAPVLKKTTVDTGGLGSIAQSASAKITSLTNTLGPLGAGLGAVSRNAPLAATGLLKVVAAQERASLLSRTLNVALLGGASAMAIGAVAAASYADDALRAADSYATLHARIRTFSEGAISAAATERDLYATAKDARASVADLTTLYTRLAPAVKDYGKTQQDALTITQLTSKALAIQGADVREQAAATVQFSQAIASGVLRGDELRSLLESSPQLLRYVAQNLEINGKVGVAFSQLRKLGEAGTLTTDKLISALLKAQPAIERDFINAPKTAQQGWIVLKDQITRTVGTIDATLGGQRAVVAWLGKMAEGAEAWRKNMLVDPAAFNNVKAIAGFVGGAVESIGDLGALAVENFDKIVTAGQAIIALKLGSVIANSFVTAAKASQDALKGLQDYRQQAGFRVGAAANPAAGQAATALRASALAADTLATEKMAAADQAAARAAIVRSAADKAQAEAEAVRTAAAAAHARSEAALAAVEAASGREIAAAERLKGEAAIIRAKLEEDAARRSAAVTVSNNAARASRELSGAGIGTAGTYYAKLAQDDARTAALFTDEQRRAQLARLAEIEVAEKRAADTVIAAETRKSAAVVAAEREMAAASALSVQAKVAETEAASLDTAATRAETAAKSTNLAATNAVTFATTRNIIAKEAETAVTVELTAAQVALGVAQKAALGLYSLLGGAVGVATLVIGGLIYAVLEAQKAEKAHYDAMRDSVDITDKLRASTDAMAAATWSEIPGIVAKTQALREQAAAQEKVLASQLKGKQAELETLRSQQGKGLSAEASEGNAYQMAALEREIRALGGVVGGARQRTAAANQEAYRVGIIQAGKDKANANAQLSRGTDAAGRPLTEEARSSLQATVKAKTDYLVSQVDKLDTDIAVVDGLIAAANKPKPRGQKVSDADKQGLAALRTALGTARDNASEGALSGAQSSFTPPGPNPKKVPGNAGVTAAYTDLLKSSFLNLSGGTGFAAKNGAVTLDGKSVSARSEDEATALAKYVKVVESLNDATDAQIKKSADALGVQTKSKAELKAAAGAILAHELATSKAAQADDKWEDIKAEMAGSTRSEVKAQRELNDLIADGATITEEGKKAYLAWIAARETAAKLQRGLQVAQPLVQRGFDLAQAGTTRPVLANGVIDDKKATEQLMAARAAVMLDRDRAVREEIAKRVAAGDLLAQDVAKATTDATAAYQVAVEISTQEQLLEIRKAKLNESVQAQEQQIAEMADAIGGAVDDLWRGDNFKDVGKHLIQDLMQAMYDELLGNPLRELIKTALRDLTKSEGGGGGKGGLFKALGSAAKAAFGSMAGGEDGGSSVHSSANKFADGRLPGYAAGRMDGVRFRGRGGPRGDDNLVRISDQEGIITARTVRTYLPILELMEKGLYDPSLGLPRHAEGYMPRVPSPASLGGGPGGGSGGRDGDVFVNNYGQPMDVTQRRDERGATHIDLRPMARAGARDAARNGDIDRGLRERIPPTRRG